MDSRKLILKQTAVMAVGEALCCGIMVAVFAALGRFHWSVVAGALAGAIAITANHFFLAIAVDQAADKAQAGDPQGAQKSLQSSATLRLIAMGAVLVLAILLGCDPVATVLPPAFARPILMVANFFGKKGD